MDITPKEFFANNPLEIEVHAMYLQTVRTILREMQRDFALDWTEEEAVAPCTKFFIVSPVTSFATTYFVIGRRITALIGINIGFMAEKKVPNRF